MRRHPALLVVLAGVTAALHIGKLPPALPVLRDSLQVTLVQAGFLLSLVQLAGMTLGLALGAAADTLGPRRTMIAGLLVLSVASGLGGMATTAEGLLVLRAAEGVGFLLATLPAPVLIRRLVDPARLSRMLGLWGAYVPLGTALALLAGPALIAAAGWPGWWWLLAALTLAMAAWMWTAIPEAADRRSGGSTGALGRVRRTLAARGPWLASLAFAMYSAQWLAVIGFLPTIYAQAGIATGYAAVATAVAAAVNIVGNVASGRLLHRGFAPTRLMQAGYLAMGLGTVLAFASWGGDGTLEALVRYAGVLLFSTVGGLVPGTLFSLAVRLAPDESTVSTTVGWMQQWSSAGQFIGAPVAAWAAATAGGWHATWWVTVSCALAGIAIAAGIAQLLAVQGPARAAAKVRP